MTTSFNVAEKGVGSYRSLAILRWVMVVIFVSFGMQKFTLQSAQGIVQFISNSPFISWLSIFGFRGEAYVLGVVEFAIAALLAAGAFSPILSAIGSLMGVITFAINKRELAGARAVDDAQIRAAMALAAQHLKVVVEPSGAAALAAVLAEPRPIGACVAVVLSGGNVDAELLAEVLRLG